MLGFSVKSIYFDNAKVRRKAIHGYIIYVHMYMYIDVD